MYFFAFLVGKELSHAGFWVGSGDGVVFPYAGLWSNHAILRSAVRLFNHTHTYLTTIPVTPVFKICCSFQLRLNRSAGAETTGLPHHRKVRDTEEGIDHFESADPFAEAPITSTERLACQISVKKGNTE